jgi:uncharacterized damage-inducible protein DinB
MIKPGLIGQLSSMQEFFDRSTRALAEQDSGFAPKDGMFTACQQVAHAAQTVEWFMHGAFAPDGFGMDFEAAEREVRAVNSLKAAREWFAKACSDAKGVVEAHSDEEWMAPLPAGPVMGGMPRYLIFGALTDHTAHHRGALTVYARLVGKVPPMPYMDM